MTRMKPPAPGSPTLLALPLVMALAGATLGTALASDGEAVAFSLSPQEQCREAALGAGEGSLTLGIEGESCVARATTVDGSLDAFVSLSPAIEGRLPQPPEFFGFFRWAQVSTTFSVPGPPPAGTELLAAHLLDHLILVWILDEEGVAFAPIGDPIAFFEPPAPPPYMAGTIAGRVRYGEPFDVTVGMTTDTHMVTVRQAGNLAGAASLKKIFPHPDRMSHASVFLASGSLEDSALWSYGAASFRGVKSPAEVIIASSAEASQQIAIRRIERHGDEVRVYLR